MMTHHNVDQLNADITIWKLRRDNWLFWAKQSPKPGFAYRGAIVCQDKINALRHERDVALAMQIMRQA